jgi:hypothetical protein
MSLLNFFHGVSTLPFNVHQEIVSQTFAINSYSPLSIENALSQPWLFVRNHSLGASEAETFMGDWSNRTKHHSHTYCVIITNKRIAATTVLTEDGKFCTEGEDNTTFLCWMTREEKIQLWVHLMKQAYSTLAADGNHIPKQLLPFCFMLSDCEWLLKGNISNEQMLRDKAKRSFVINWLHYADETTYALPTAPDTRMPLNGYKLACYAGYYMFVMVEKHAYVPYQHAMMRWLKLVLAEYEEEYNAQKRIVHNVFNRQVYQQWVRPENEAHLKRFQKAIGNVIHGLLYSSVKKEAAVETQGHKFMNNQKPVSDRYIWMTRLPSYLDRKSALTPAANPIICTNYSTIELSAVQQGDLELLRQLSLRVNDDHVYIVMEKTSALRVNRVLDEYVHLWMPLQDAAKPHLYDIQHNDQPATLMVWNRHAMYTLQCLAVCNAVGKNTDKRKQFQYGLPLGQLLSYTDWNAEANTYPNLITQYLKGIYLLLNNNQPANCHDNELYGYIYNTLDKDPVANASNVNATYNRLVGHILATGENDDGSRAHSYMLPYTEKVGEKNVQKRHIRASDIKWLMLSLLSPHCTRVIDQKSVASLGAKYPAAYNLLRERVDLEQPKAIKFEWQNHRDRRTVDFDKPVISQEQKILNDQNWYEVKPCVFMNLMDACVADKLQPIEIWYLIHRLRAVMPCSVAHLKHVFDNPNTKYPSNWMDLTTSIPAKDKAHMPTQRIDPITKPDEVITKLLWVAVHAMLMGIPSVTELLPPNAYINDNSHDWRNLEATLLSTTRSPRVMVDTTNSDDRYLHDTFLLADVFLPHIGNPIAPWYESMAQSLPPVHASYVDVVQQRMLDACSGADAPRVKRGLAPVTERPNVTIDTGESSGAAAAAALESPHLMFTDNTSGVAYSPGREKQVTPTSRRGLLSKNTTPTHVSKRSRSSSVKPTN